MRFAFLRSSQICIRTVQALLPLAGDGPSLDSQIIAYGTTMPQSVQALSRLGQVIETALSVSPAVTTRHGE